MNYSYSFTVYYLCDAILVHWIICYLLYGILDLAVLSLLEAVAALMISCYVIYLNFVISIYIFCPLHFTIKYRLLCFLFLVRSIILCNVIIICLNWWIISTLCRSLELMIPLRLKKDLIAVCQTKMNHCTAKAVVIQQMVWHQII